MQRLIYVSESNIEDADADAVCAQIVAVAQKRNAKLNLTGALLFTGTHFAQVLEGSPIDIDELMESLYNDIRHSAVTVVDRSPINERVFPNWQMAYQGPSQFVSRHVTRLLHPASASEKLRAADWLVELVSEFSIA